jgi:glycosyltransferase involved in cell wall biosynthesis
MKILLIMDPGILVPPKGYGGHERLVYMFAKEYHRLGHEVHLLVTEGSQVSGCYVHSIGKEGFPPGKKEMYRATFCAWTFLIKQRNTFDIVHNFGRLLYLLPILNCRVKKIMTYGRIINRRNISVINQFPTKNIVFTAPSDWCKNTGNSAGNWLTIYNAIDFDAYTLQKEVPLDAPLIFLSRLEKLKGAHDAIKVALETNNKLILAGNISPLKEEREYFDNEIKPYIDGKNIIYVGTLDDKGKNYYLGKAKAMLFPARTEEAFGMVLIEAMSCGTPVIAFSSGATSEIVEEGKTGYIVADIDGMKKAIDNITSINREKCRNAAEEKYDVKKITREYLNIFN